MENKYQNGKIYKIVCNQTGKIYIGSTIQPLNNRLLNHKSNYNGYLKGKQTYTTSFEIIETNNYHIELICDYPCSCKKELETMEAKYIREMECINKCIPCRTIEEKKELSKEYREQNKEHLNQYQKKYRKQYYEQNRDKIKEFTKQYKEQYKEKIKERSKEYYQQNRERSKEYYQQNKDKIKEYRKEYYERNKQNKIS